MLIPECPYCGYKSQSEDAYFCIKCGTAIKNLCTNDDCKHINQPDASFCEKCGSITYNKRHDNI